MNFVIQHVPFWNQIKWNIVIWNTNFKSTFEILPNWKYSNWFWAHLATFIVKQFFVLFQVKGSSLSFHWRLKKQWNMQGGCKITIGKPKKQRKWIFISIHQGKTMFSKRFYTEEFFSFMLFFHQIFSSRHENRHSTLLMELDIPSSKGKAALPWKSSQMFEDFLCFVMESFFYYFFKQITHEFIKEGKENKKL